MIITNFFFLNLLLGMPVVAYANGSNGVAAGVAGVFFSILFFLVIFLVITFVSLISIGGTILWIFMLIDCARREFKNSNDKLLWILIIVLAGFIGAVVYYFAVKKKDSDKGKKQKSKSKSKIKRQK